MEPKAPVLLTLLVDVSRLRWLVAAIGLDGEVLPLAASEDGDLEPYLTLDFDEQVGFLRHRLSGVLQRGCDRLWARTKKPCQVVFIAQRRLDESTGPLTQRLAEHFNHWLTSPPVVFFVSRHGFSPHDPVKLDRLAGELQSSWLVALEAGLPELFRATTESDRWEQIAKKAYSKRASEA